MRVPGFSCQKSNVADPVFFNKMANDRFCGIIVVDMDGREKVAVFIYEKHFSPVCFTKPRLDFLNYTFGLDGVGHDDDRVKLVK